VIILNRHSSDYLWTGRPGFDSRQGQRFFFSSPRSDRLWGPPRLLSRGYRELFPGGTAAETWSWHLASI